MQDELGDRMKMLESMEAGRKFMPLLPILGRVDGRSFHLFTKGMNRPFDQRIIDCMIKTAIALLAETNASMAYTQSDEITLAWHSTDYQSQLWFDGRISKMVSQLGALTTLYFNRAIIESLPDYVNKLPTFDARAWQVPNRTEAANSFLWREWDASKNSITMAASAYYSHSQLHGVHGDQKKELLVQKGIDYEDYPTAFKRGTFIQRKKVVRAFSTDELARLPEKHEARTNSNLLVERSEIQVVDMPSFVLVSNREDVIFEGALPEILSNKGTIAPC